MRETDECRRGKEKLKLVLDSFYQKQQQYLVFTLYLAHGRDPHYLTLTLAFVLVLSHIQAPMQDISTLSPELTKPIVLTTNKIPLLLLQSTTKPDNPDSAFHTTNSNLKEKNSNKTTVI